MGDLRDLDRFVRFARKDALNTIKDNPARLLYGAVDPASTWGWNQLLGRDDKPILNQLGSPMGSGDLGLGGSGGVYGRADDAGVDANMGRTFFGIGDTIAGFYGGSAVNGLLGGGSSGGASVASEFSQPAMSGSAMGNSGVAAEFATPAMSIGTPSSTASTARGASLMQHGQGLLKQQPQQPQQPIQQQAPVKNPQDQQRRNAMVQQQMLIQSLRQKPNKTLEEWQMLQKLQQDPERGLLG